jgi:CheY-like chemotaxis protein
MDSEMPILDGTSAMKKIREELQERAPYMVVVTASAMPGDRDRFIGAGFNAYLSKPLVLSTLAEIIKDAWMNTRRLK